MLYSESNIEDWDFRHCSPSDPKYDVEADLFFSTHFTTAMAVDLIRLGVISTFIDKGIAEVEEDREHVRLLPQADGILQGWKSGTSRFTRTGRFERKVVEALRRENRKYGRLRVTILPQLRGFTSNTEGDDHPRRRTDAVHPDLERELRIERTMQRVVRFKKVVIGLGSLALAAIALLNLVTGNWVAALLIFLVGELIWYVVADIVTGILVAPFVGAVVFRNRRTR